MPPWLSVGIVSVHQVLPIEWTRFEASIPRTHVPGTYSSSRLFRFVLWKNSKLATRESRRRHGMHAIDMISMFSASLHPGINISFPFFCFQFLAHFWTRIRGMSQAFSWVQDQPPSYGEHGRMLKPSTMCPHTSIHVPCLGHSWRWD